MVQILLVRAGLTDFDEQGRIKGTLDIPLNEVGQDQVAQLVADLRDVRIDSLYASPSRSAHQTAAALERVRSVVLRLIRKHRSGTVAIVVPEPLASLVRSTLNHGELGDLWKAECESGGWQMMDVQAEKVALAS